MKFKINSKLLTEAQLTGKGIRQDATKLAEAIAILLGNIFGITEAVNMALSNDVKLSRIAREAGDVSYFYFCGFTNTNSDIFTEVIKTAMLNLDIIEEYLKSTGAPLTFTPSQIKAFLSETKEANDLLLAYLAEYAEPNEKPRQQTPLRKAKHNMFENIAMTYPLNEVTSVIEEQRERIKAAKDIVSLLAEICDEAWGGYSDDTWEFDEDYTSKDIEKLANDSYSMEDLYCSGLLAQEKFLNTKFIWLAFKKLNEAQETIEDKLVLSVGNKKYLTKISILKKMLTEYDEKYVDPPLATVPSRKAKKNMFD